MQQVKITLNTKLFLPSTPIMSPWQQNCKERPLSPGQFLNLGGIRVVESGLLQHKGILIYNLHVPV